MTRLPPANMNFGENGRELAGIHDKTNGNGHTQGSANESQRPMLLTSADAARALQISPRKLWELMTRGDIPHVRIGRAVRFRLEDLEKWIEDHRRRGHRSARGDP